MDTIHENVAIFGRFGGLVGVVSERVGEPPGITDPDEQDLPAVVILNTGIIHRVGVGRMSTIWARRIAGAGYCVLRFDLSGIGDSERRRDSLPPTEAALADLRDAVDWLQSTRGVRRVILIGLCSGANLSLLYSGTDSRVCGMVIIDPSTPPTRMHYLQKLLTPEVWKRKFQTAWNLMKSLFDRLPDQAAESGGQYDYAPVNRTRGRKMLCEAYQTAFAQTIKTLAIFTSGDSWYNYREQLFDAFPEICFDGNLQLEYFERCDHTITHEANRNRLFDVASSWLTRTEFKLPPIAAESPQRSSLTSGADSKGLVSVEF